MSKKFSIIRTKIDINKLLNNIEEYSIINIVNPYLSWNCQGGKKQTAFEVEAVSEGQVIWNSGKVISDVMNVLLGVTAESKQRISWKVRLWDENDTEGEWSEEAFFEMGILDRSQFVAKWINPELTCDPGVHKPASYLKTSFNVEKMGKARIKQIRGTIN